MSNYYLALASPLYVISFEEVMKSLGSSLHRLKGRNPYGLETIDSFTNLFPGSKELYDYLKKYQLIPDDMPEGEFLIVEVDNELEVIHMKVRYRRMENLFSIETLMITIERLYLREDTHIAYEIGWKIRRPALMRSKAELSLEELINTCREYVSSSNGKEDYRRLRYLAMIVDHYQQESKNMKNDEKLVDHRH